MDRSIIYFGIFFFLIVGWKDTASSEAALRDSEITSEIDSLQNPALKKAFLEEIFTRDQGVRQRLNQQMEDFDYDFEEVEVARQQMMRQDTENLLKLEKYLAAYPYPDELELGRTAADTPWLVIHHSGPLSKRNEYFKLLYKAHLDGNLDDDQMSLYLGRSYTMKNGERLKMEGPYKSEEQINLLIKGLDLEEEQAEVLKERNRLTESSSHAEI